MSESQSASRQLPPRPSLEQLRKQAKELSASNDVPLAEAQFTLARQYGFANWAELVRHIESLQPPTLPQFERLASDVLSAFRDGDAGARERVEGHLNIRILSPQTLRARLKDQLGVTAESPQNPQLTAADAQSFVARAHGFETWADLATHMSPKGSARSRDDARSYSIDRERNIISPRHALTRKDWDEIVAVMDEERITGLDAGGQMTDDVLDQVTRLDFVTHLGLGGSDKLTDSGLLHVARLVGLEQLDVGGWTSPISDRGLAALRGLRELRRFHACWSQRISDVGLAHLKNCERLESVDLMGTPAGDGTLAALAGKAGLRIMKVGRGLTDAGLPHLRDFPAFASRTWKSGEAELGLMSYSDGPTHLMLDGPFTSKGLARLTADGLAGVFGINIFWHASRLTSDGLEPLAHLENLELFGCKGELCDDRAMRHVAAMPRLRVLMAQGMVAGDAGFASLSRSRSIEHIWGRECPNLRGRGFASLAAMPSLRGIAVSCKKVDDASLATLPSFPSLEQLLPMDVSDAGFRHVGGCEKLVNLWCMYCRDTGDAATGHIAGLPRLQTYYAGNTQITDKSLEILSRIATLEKLEFWQIAKITDAGVALLPRLPRLRAVTVDGCPKVTRAGMGVFPPTVRINYGT